MSGWTEALPLWDGGAVAESHAAWPTARPTGGPWPSAKGLFCHFCPQSWELQDSPSRLSLEQGVPERTQDVLILQSVGVLTEPGLPGNSDLTGHLASLAHRLVYMGAS